MSSARLASDFWVAAKLRQLQNAGGYASILVKGHAEAGTINLVLRERDGTLRLAIPAILSEEASAERRFEWRSGTLNDEELKVHIEREIHFDRDQWFIEVECSLKQFEDVFEVCSV